MHSIAISILNFLHLAITPPESSALYTGSYDPVLVGLSIVIAIFASYASLLVAQHVSATATTTTKRLWIAGGGLNLGFGIWAMHFVGMLAFSLPCSSSYDATITLLSIIPGVLASTLALKIISRRTISHTQLAMGGLLIGAGIGTMHYSGMAAMRLNGLIRYDIKLFLLSFLVAFALATLALWIKFRLQPLQARWNVWVSIASAVVMGLAVSGMHYTAMTGAYFIRDGDPALVTSGMTSTLLASIVLAATGMIIVVTIVATYFDTPNRSSLRRPYKLIGLLIAGWIAISWFSADYYYSRLANTVYQRETQLATQEADNIAGNIGKSIELLKRISLVLSHDSNAYQALHRFGENAAPSALPYEERKQRWTQDNALGELDNSLDVAATHLGADIIFIINAAGDCIAASNAGKSGSSVGANFADRAYFPQVKAGLPGRQYAMGRTTNVPGLYYASPVIEKGRFLGAVVVKRDITKFASWTNQANAFITDANGVIVLAPDKRFEFRTLPNAPIAKLPAEQIQLQYKRSALEPLAITPWRDERFPDARLIGDAPTPAVLVSKKLSEDDAIAVYVPRPLGELMRFGRERYWFFLLLAAAGGMLIVAASAVVLYLRESQRTAAELRIAATAFESQEGILITDTHGAILRVNQAFTKITGYTEEETLGANPRILQSGHHNAEFYAAMWESINRTGTWGGEVWSKRKNGEIFPEYLNITAVKDENGVVTNHVATLTDITERKQTEQVLIAARDEADRANRAKSEFLSSMSHELRTPLNIILGFAQLLELNEGLDEEGKENVQEILKAGDHLLELIKDVLNLAVIESGRIDLSLELVTVDPIIEECLRLVSTLANKRDIHLSYAGLEQAAVRADRSRLKQVLLNLLSNAVKYNREGGSVKVSLVPEDAERLRILVTDTGLGIPAARLQEVFQPFNRLGNEGLTIEGTGIGLTITRRLVEMMGGTVAVESELGVGSTFWIELPLESTPKAGNGSNRKGTTADNATPAQSGDLAQHTVLYIEDNPPSIKLVEQMLGRRRNIRLITAHTSALGIELAQAHRPDLILLDINLPGMDGYRILEVLKADSSLKATPVIAVSANAMPSDIERGMAAGFTDYLTKPLNVLRFYAVMDRLLADGQPESQ